MLTILIGGFTFKENCPDMRNIKAIVVYEVLKGIFELIMPSLSKNTTKVINGPLNTNCYDVCIAAVAHRRFER